MDEVLVFQHDPFEDLGFFAEVLEKLGAKVSRLKDVGSQRANTAYPKAM